MSEQYYEGQKEQEQESLSVALPKNIRQIGQPGEKHNVYIEDYVYTYLHMFLKEKYKDDTLKAAVLLGNIQKQKERSYAFVNGAIACEFSWLHEGNEHEVRQLVADHFQDTDILGWYVGCRGQDSHIQSIVKHHYAQQAFEAAKYFIYEDELEGELEIYGWEQNALHKMGGYYIYYEKNPQMQEFLIREKNAKPQETSTQEEEAAVKYVNPSRQEVLARQEESRKTNTRSKPQKAVYAACAAVLIVVAATGVSQIGNYQNLKNFQETMMQFTSPGENEDDLSEDSGETENNVKPDDENADDKTDDAKDPGADSLDENVNEQDEIQENKNTSKAESHTEDSQNTVGQTDTQQSTAESTGGQVDTQQFTAGNTAGQADTQQTDVQSAAGQAETAQTSEQPQYYVVKKGDSLLSISRQIYKSTNMVNAIRSANNIDNMDVIYEGQRLLLP